MDISINFFESTFATYFVMTVLGVVKHYKEGTADWKVFIFKTIVQAGIMLGVMFLGLSASVFLLAVSKVAGVFLGKQPLSMDSCMYFFYSSFGILFGYHFIKGVDLVNQIAPNLVPRWFYKVFLKYRKTGNFADILNLPSSVSDEEEEKTKTPS